jgi:hypothetical protein
MTVRHLIAFADVQAENQDGDTSDWQRVYEDLLRADTLLDITLAVARFRATADERRRAGGAGRALSLLSRWISVRTGR